MTEIEWLAPCVSEKIDEFNEQWSYAAYGPAHIVVDDYNALDGHINFCLREIENYDRENYTFDHSPEELAATKELLEWLLTIPEYKRYGEG